MTLRIDHATIAGTFSLDGRTHDVTNNVWVIGDDDECAIIDAPHDAQPILDLVGARRVTGILLTHGHDDHISAVGALWDETGGTIQLHPADRMLWDRVYGDVAPDAELADGQELTVGGAALQVIHTPGHSPGSVSFYLPALGTVFSGDTLLAGGPGATGGSFSDFTTIIESNEKRLAPLPPETVVRPGHGDSTTIAEVTPRIVGSPR